MSSLRITWCLLQARGLRHLITVLVLALGIGLMISAAAVTDAARTSLRVATQRYPLVIGGEVGAVSLVLGSMTHLQNLGPGVSADLADRLRGDERTESVVPLLMGHAIGEFTLLATSEEYLRPRRRYPLQEGRTFRSTEMAVVAGAKAAKGLGLALGQEVEIKHQLASAPKNPGHLRVVGILEQTNSEVDSTLYCPLEAVFASCCHRHHGETGSSAGHHGRLVSAILVRPTNERALLSLQEELAALPGVEVALTGQTLRRVGDQIASGGQLLEILVGGIFLITFLTLLLTVYTTSAGLSREIAVMRVMGASRTRVVAIVALMSLALVLAGSLLGVVGGGLLGSFGEDILRNNLGLDAQVSVLSGTAVQYLAGIAAVFCFAGLQPAFSAYSLQAAEAVNQLPGSGRAMRRSMYWPSRILLVVALMFWFGRLVTVHSSEGTTTPLDAKSAAVFRTLTQWTSGDPPAAMRDLDGKPLTIEGYMYAVGDPFTVQDFYLVALNPNLPRCPFCYRAPMRRERIKVRAGGKQLDFTSGKVKVSGRFHLAPEQDDPYWIEMTTFDVVIPE